MLSSFLFDIFHTTKLAHGSEVSFRLRLQPEMLQDLLSLNSAAKQKGDEQANLNCSYHKLRICGCHCKDNISDLTVLCELDGFMDTSVWEPPK